MSCLIGHGQPEVVETLRKHAAELDNLYRGMASPPVINLASLLTSVLPEGLDKAVFLSTGGESNECAIKLAKVYTGKFEIVGLGASWHGMTCGANAAQISIGRKGYGPLVSTYSTFARSLPSLPTKRTKRTNTFALKMPGMHMLPSPDSYCSNLRLLLRLPQHRWYLRLANGARLRLDSNRQSLLRFPRRRNNGTYSLLWRHDNHSARLHGSNEVSLP